MSAIAVLLDKNLGLETRLYVNLRAVFPGELKACQTVKLDNIIYAGTSVEAPIGPHGGLLAQIIDQTSLFPHTGISEIDNTALIMMLGGRYYIGPAASNYR